MAMSGETKKAEEATALAEDNDNSDDDDEDYNPEKDKDVDAGNHDDDAMDIVEEEPFHSSTKLTPSQKRGVDEAFQDLFGYEWGTSFQLPRRQKRLMNNQEKVLLQILGPERAARILKTQGQRRRSMAVKRPATLQKWTKDDSTNSNNNNASKVMPQQQSAPQFETKLFAGKKIQVAVTGSKVSAKDTTVINKKHGNIDSVLEQLAGPSKISTVAKTSSDWDSFKTETGLEAELEKKAQGKDAFLVKQDFLTRVDNRKFELERDERDKERAKRGK